MATAQLRAPATGDGDFPHYTDGDCLVVLSPTRQYQLHSRTLRLHSDYFKKLLTDDKAAHLSSKTRRDGLNVRYRVELELKRDDDGDIGQFRLRALDERGRAQGNYSRADLENGTLSLPIYQHYDNMLRAYYYQPVNLDETNISYVLRDIVGLVDVAEYLGSMRVVTLCIDNALVKQGQVLYRSIATTPTAWADLAFRARSEIIFCEAVIHLVGQWPELSRNPEALAIIRPEISELCARKHADLDETKRAIELRIMGHYPQHLQKMGGAATGGPANTGPGSRTIRGTGRSNRSTQYGIDVMAWMALNLFRHWLGQHVCGDLNRHASDGGYVFYHAISAGGDHYVDHAAIENFTQYFPLSSKSRNIFERQLSILKEGVRPYVQALVEHRSMLDINRWPVKYLTCAEVDKDDLPWQMEGGPRAAETARMVPSAVGLASRPKRKSGEMGGESSDRTARRLKRRHPSHEAVADPEADAEGDVDHGDYAHGRYEDGIEEGSSHMRGGAWNGIGESMDDDGVGSLEGDGERRFEGYEDYENGGGEDGDGYGGDGYDEVFR